MLGEHRAPQRVKGSLGPAAAHPAAGAAAVRAAALALLCTLIVGVLAGGLAGRSATAPGVRPAAETGPGLLALPPALRALVSARLGADDPAYRLSTGSGALAAASPAQGLQLRFGRSSVTVSAGATRVRLALRGIGYGAAPDESAATSRLASGNRVAYRHAGAREWYANGPLGLEQGFTLYRPPSGRSSSPLTLSLALGGNARVSLGAGGRSATFSTAGGSQLRYGALSATDASGRSLPVRLALDGRRLLLRVQAQGARFPLRIDPLVQQGPKLRGEGMLGVPGFGVSVALSGDGNTALVGGSGDNGRVGAAWVFTRSGSTWAQQAKLVASDEVGEGGFGGKVALSADGTTALIGGRGDDGFTGAAWVFARTGSSWSQQGPKLVGAEMNGPADFGGAVALSANGSTALIGGWNDGTEYGAAWVFTRTGSTWTQQGPKIVPPEVEGLPFIGKSVALSADGNTALIAGPWDNDIGAVWVYTRSGSTWTQQGPKLKGGGEIGKGFFGESVSLSADGNTALIGGEWDLIKFGPEDFRQLGAAWVFTRSGSAWSQQGPKLFPSDEHAPGFFGESVSLSADGNTALIGGWRDSGYTGAAWLFTRSGSTWSQSGPKLLGSGETTHPEFGVSVALSGDAQTALVGGRGDSEFTGSAWPFAFQASSPPDPAQFGRCVKTRRVRGAVPAGEFAHPGCKDTSGSGRYLWRSGVARRGFTSTLAGGRVTLETVGGARVTCTTETGSGEYSGSGLTTVGSVVLTFGGCELAGSSCASAGGGEGVITTNPLAGVLGITTIGETRSANRIGLRLSAAGEGGRVMQFSCGSVPVSVHGSVIVPVRTNKMLARSTLHFTASKGVQRPEAFAGEPAATLEASIDSQPYEQAGLNLHATQANEEPVEVNSTR